jgi:hypothetical protein
LVGDSEDTQQAVARNRSKAFLSRPVLGIYPCLGTMLVSDSHLRFCTVFPLAYSLARSEDSIVSRRNHFAEFSRFGASIHDVPPQSAGSEIIAHQLPDCPL